MADYSLVCPFLDGGAAYARGVEFGLVYAALRRRPRVWADHVTRANEDQVLLLASRLGYRVRTRLYRVEGWVWIELRRRRKVA